jgi:hypothetical protein
MSTANAQSSRPRPKLHNLSSGDGAHAEGAKRPFINELIDALIIVFRTNKGSGRHETRPPRPSWLG